MTRTPEVLSMLLVRGVDECSNTAQLQVHVENFDGQLRHLLGLQLCQAHRAQDDVVKHSWK